MSSPTQCPNCSVYYAKRDPYAKPVRLPCGAVTCRQCAVNSAYQSIGIDCNSCGRMHPFTSSPDDILTSAWDLIAASKKRPSASNVQHEYSSPGDEAALAGFPVGSQPLDSASPPGSRSRTSSDVSDSSGGLTSQRGYGPGRDLTPFAFDGDHDPLLNTPIEGTPARKEVAKASVKVHGRVSSSRPTAIARDLLQPGADFDNAVAGMGEAYISAGGRDSASSAATWSQLGRIPSSGAMRASGIGGDSPKRGGGGSREQSKAPKGRARSGSKSSSVNTGDDNWAPIPPPNTGAPPAAWEGAVREGAYQGPPSLQRIFAASAKTQHTPAAEASPLPPPMSQLGAIAASNGGAGAFTPKLLTALGLMPAAAQAAQPPLVPSPSAASVPGGDHVTEEGTRAGQMLLAQLQSGAPLRNLSVANPHGFGTPPSVSPPAPLPSASSSSLRAGSLIDHIMSGTPLPPRQQAHVGALGGAYSGLNIGLSAPPPAPVALAPYLPPPAHTPTHSRHCEGGLTVVLWDVENCHFGKRSGVPELGDADFPDDGRRIQAGDLMQALRWRLSVEGLTTDGDRSDFYVFYNPREKSAYNLSGERADQLVREGAWLVDVGSKRGAADLRMHTKVDELVRDFTEFGMRLSNVVLMSSDSDFAADIRKLLNARNDRREFVNVVLVHDRQ